MKSWVQFITTPTADTPGTTLILRHGTKAYLIGNVAEGTQRAAVQQKTGLVKVGNIFLTGTTSWGTAGGLMGMILTLADSATSSYEQKKKAVAANAADGEVGDAEQKKNALWLHLHGGENLAHTIATARRFIFRKGRPLQINEFRAKDQGTADWEPTWKDENIKVWAMVIEPEAQVQSGSPRKRRSDEISTDDGSVESLTVKPGPDAEREEQNDQIRKAIVADMFDSDWRMDALVKMKLSEVRLPAAIFRRDDEGKIEKYTGAMPSDDPSVGDIDVLCRKPWPGALIDELPPTQRSTSSVCYIIKNYPQRGKFDPKAAIAAGVKPGPEFSKLSGGKNVTTAAGNIVTPDMVLGPGKEGGGFVIVELRDESYIAPLLARAEWSTKQVMAGVEIVVWILAPGLIQDQRIQEFMEKRKEFKHIVSSTDCCSNYLAMESVASAQLRLNMLDSERFPIPKYSHEILDTGSNTKRTYQRARVGQTLLLEPKCDVLDDDVAPYLNTEAVINEFKESSKEVIQLAEAAHAHVDSEEYQTLLEETQEDIPCKDAEVISLGTGSALPSKYRNVSATLVTVPEYGNYLFDAGENTLGQLKRVYGDELPAILRDLKAIWISHLHADHHLGTASVIKAWADETKKHEDTKNNQLIIGSHQDMHKWLAEYSQVEDFGHDRTLPVPMRPHYRWIHNFQSEDTRRFGLTSMVSCGVVHCNGALAVAFNFPNGFKIAYSGDCRPSHDFIQIGQDATLLIHEATFDDELQGDALAKKHSTTSEALSVGRDMNARRILLTHFSQRYQKIPVMDSDDGKDQVAIVAFDYMRCKIKDFAKMEDFKPALIKLYEDVEQ